MARHERLILSTTHSHSHKTNRRSFHQLIHLSTHSYSFCSTSRTFQSFPPWIRGKRSQEPIPAFLRCLLFLNTSNSFDALNVPIVLLFPGLPTTLIRVRCSCPLCPHSYLNKCGTGLLTGTGRHIHKVGQRALATCLCFSHVLALWPQV